MSHAPDNLFVVLDQDGKFISVSAVKSSLIQFVQDHPQNDWKVYRIRNNEYWDIIRPGGYDDERAASKDYDWTEEDLLELEAQSEKDRREVIEPKQVYPVINVTKQS